MGKKSWIAGLLSAALLVLPAAAQDIVLGQIGPFTGLPVPDATQVNQGIKAYLAQANKTGGVNGRKVVLFELDDGYNADGFVARFEEAMKRRPVALLSPIGSAAVKRMLDDKLLDKHDVVVINAVPGAEALRNPGHPRLFHVRTGDKQQLEKIVLHARTIGITKLGVLYQSIPIGTSGFKVVTDEAARQPGLQITGFQSANEPAALEQATQALAKSEPSGVIVIGAPPFATAGVVQLRKAGMTQATFILSDTSPNLLVKVAGAEAARGVGIVQIFPNPNGKPLLMVREFQQAMKAAYPDLESYAPFQMEGYLSAKILVDAMRRIKGEITPAAIAKALPALGEIDYQGLVVDFSKGNAGGRYTNIAVMDVDGRLRY